MHSVFYGKSGVTPRCRASMGKRVRKGMTCGACTSVRQRRRDSGGITKEHINLYTPASGSDGAAYVHNAMVQRISELYFS
jgi:hypothetical protein